MAIDTTNDVETIDRPPISCPKCAAAMEKVTFQNIEVDRCINCKGLWFDMLEREHLDELKGSESIDIGPAHKEARDEVVRINCPVCHTPMIRMVDLNNPSIWYESCKVCYGVFYDAGEFREHKEHHVLGFFKDLFNRTERK
jgi:Zn-finger nucleic acid-binding protein